MKTFMFILVYMPFITLAQFKYVGIVVNKQDKKPVPYATISLKNENKGINADEKGSFSLESSTHENDTLIFSSVGYINDKIPVSSYSKYMVVELNQKDIGLKEVVLSSSYSHKLKINDFTGCGLNYYTSSQRVTQVAQHLFSPSSNALVSKVFICKDGDNSLFRIRLYKMDSVSGRPSLDLVDTIIQVRSGKRHVMVDVEALNIILLQQDFFIAIEWLFTENNQRKVKAHKSENRSAYFQYSPYISFKQRKKGDADLPVWQLNRQGQWIPFEHASGLLISAELKY